jgi:drug/metabolite transporter (DMT)-like permease
VPSSQKKAYLLVVLGVLMVSYSGPMVRGALLQGATPVTVAFLRMLFSGLLLLPLSLRKPAGETHSSLMLVLRAPRRQLFLGVIAAAFLALHYFTWMTSLSSTSTFASVALVCTQPLFVAAFSGLLLHEPMQKSARPGALVALAGALLIGSSSLSGLGGNIGGDLLALLGAVAMAGHWLCGRHARKSLPSMGYTVFVYLLTACFLALLLPVSGGLVLPGNAIWYLAGLVLGSTLLGHAVFTYTLGMVSAHVVSFALLGEPVGAMIFALLMFGEKPGPLLLLGGGVVLMGLFLYLRATSAPSESAGKAL